MPILSVDGQAGRQAGRQTGRQAGRQIQSFTYRRLDLLELDPVTVCLVLLLGRVAQDLVVPTPENIIVN